MKHWFVLLLAGVLAARAHDPYEITSVVYIQSNRIELLIEMEFPAGMILSGLEPSRSVAAETQFEAGLPQLKQFVGGLLEMTAGNNVVQPLQTNVELGVEMHIRGRLEFALTNYRPLRFVPKGLQARPDSPYGVSLTVLDMVNQKVLGQTTLFADSPAAEFPSDTSTTVSPGGPTLAVVTTREPAGVVARTNVLAGVAEPGVHRQSRLPVAVLIIACLAAALITWRWSNSRA